MHHIAYPIPYRFIFAEYLGCMQETLPGDVVIRTKLALKSLLLPDGTCHVKNKSRGWVATARAYDQKFCLLPPPPHSF